MSVPWEDYKQEICRMYLDKDMTLQEVIREMYERYNFKASDRTYKQKLKEWNAKKRPYHRQLLGPSPYLGSAPLQDSDSATLHSSTTATLQDSDSATLHSSTTATLQDSGYATQASLSTASELSFSSRPLSSSRGHQLRDENVQIYPLRQVPTQNHSDKLRSDQRLHTSVASSSKQQLDHSVNIQKPGVDLGLPKSEQVIGDSSPTIPVPVSVVACRNHTSPISRLSEWTYPHAPPSRCWAADELMTQPLGHPSTECVWCGLNEMHHLSSQARETDLTVFKRCLHMHQDKILRYDNKGHSCLHFAAGAGASKEHLAALVDMGVSMMAMNEDNETFLHVLDTRALQSAELVLILRWSVDQGFNMQRKDRQGRTVWHAIFQSGISIDTFSKLQPLIVSQLEIFRVQDHDDHTPFDCLRSFWTTCRDDAALARFYSLQISGQLPLCISTPDGLGNVTEVVPSALSPQISMLFVDEDERS